MPARGIAKRVLVDVGVGLGIIAPAGSLFAISLVAGKEVAVRWIGLVCMTPVIFWAALKQFKRIGVSPPSGWPQRFY